MILTVPARRLVRHIMPTKMVGAAVGIGVGIGVAATLLATPALLAQDARPAASSALEDIADPKAREALQSVFNDAVSKGIPTAPLVTKVREGLAKRATPDRIQAATSALAQRLASAATALAPTRSIDEIAAGADVLQSGIPVATLRDMRNIWPVKPLTVPLGVLAELVASGVPQGNATKRVRELLVKGANTTQLAALGTNVRADVEAGLAPDASMELRSKGVLSILSPSAQGNIGITGPLRPPIRK